MTLSSDSLLPPLSMRPVVWLPRVAGAYALVGGLLTLIGWAANVPRLTDWEGYGISMMPNAAVCAMSAGTALICLTLGWRRVTAILGVFAGLIGAATFFEYLSGFDLGIDRLIVSRDWGQLGTVVPGRMCPPGSISWTILGVALLLASGGPRMRRGASMLALLVIAIALLSLSGYWFGASKLYTVPHLTTIALQTASIIAVLGVGLVAVVSESGFGAALRRDDAGGVMLRRLIPPVIALPLIIGWLRVLGQDAGLYDTAFGTAARTVVELLLMVGLLWWTANGISGIERKRKSTEEALRRSQQELSDFFENASIGLHWVGPDGVILHVNQHELDLLGYGREEYVGRNLAEFHVDKPVIDDILARLTRGETLQECPARMRCKDGSIRDVLINSSVLFEDGQFIHTRCFTLDVTDRKGADQVRALLAAIVESSDDAIISKSLEGIIQTWNRGAERIFGHTSAYAIGRHISLIIPADRIAEEGRILSQLRAGKRVEHLDTVRQRSDGRLIDVSLTVSPVRDEAGRIIGASKVARDITERKRQEEHIEEVLQQRTAELETTFRHLREAERFASIGSLAAGLGHDLSNLLLPMTMRIDLLRKEMLSESGGESVESMAASVAYLKRLASSLRLLAADPEHTGSPNATTDLKDWCETATPVFKALVQRGIILVCAADLGESESGSPLLAQIDAGRLLQIVFNLVQNAVEAMNQAGLNGGERIEVRARAVPSQEHDGMERVELTVTDNGPGMAPEILARCMEPYFSTKAKGLSGGMGLSIVRRFIEEAGGTIDVRSLPLTATTFTIVLPAVREGDRVPVAAMFTPGGVAAVTISDRRAQAHLQWVLRGIGMTAVSVPPNQPPDSGLWIVEPAHVDSAAAFAAQGNAIAIILGLPPQPPTKADRLVFIGERPTVAAIRGVLEQLTKPTTTEGNSDEHA